MVNLTIDQVREILGRRRHGPRFSCEDFLFNHLDEDCEVDFDAGTGFPASFYMSLGCTAFSTLVAIEPDTKHIVKVPDSGQRGVLNDNHKPSYSSHSTSSRQAIEAWLGITPHGKAYVSIRTKDPLLSKGNQRQNKKHFQNSR